jgi:AbrB family looped-hinge helix DNA binding protein
MITTVRVQEKGRVTIPKAIRRQMKLKKGDLVTFVSTKNGILIKSLGSATDELLNDLSKKLQNRGIDLESVLDRSQQVSAEVLAKEFELKPDERKILFQALQFKAQEAFEAIRSIEELSTSTELSEEDIEKEIQDVRKQQRHANRA